MCLVYFCVRAELGVKIGYELTPNDRRATGLPLIDIVV